MKLRGNLKPTPPPVTSRLARLLALAHHVEGMDISYAEAARQLGITRARMSQIASLVNLSPRIQEAILTGEVPGLTERKCRHLRNLSTWSEQTFESQKARGSKNGESASC